ncbi:MAG: hypothetical protein JXB04_03080 [Kiritimatiellae bacterium]|nr:hypothetical protein [Kiritimatiellia bacterium]
MAKNRTVRTVVLVGVVVLFAVVLTFAHRATRAYRVAAGTRDQILYLIENGGTIGEVPASSAFSADFLGTIFGSEPELLAQLRRIVEQGLADTPVLNLGEVTGMIVTYRKTDDGKVKDVVAHVLGGFPLTKRKQGLHRDGYFRQLIDPDLWQAGNSAVAMLGRDLVLFGDPDVVEAHQSLLDATLAGNILPLAESLNEPLYYSAVFPQPRGIVARGLQAHVRTVILKGFLAMYEGANEAVILTPSAKSAAYTVQVLSDLKTGAEVALRTKWKGVQRETPWGPVIDPWWAYELAETIEKKTILEREDNVVRATTEYQDAMVNVALKSLERMGRDLAAMRGTLDERLDPRLVDARMQTRKPLHYWSEDHRWGPYWPIAPRDTNLLAQAQANVAAFEERKAAEAAARAAAEAAPTEEPAVP